MYTKNIFAAGALLSVVAAVPMVKRDIVWVTETDEAVVTVPVTTTVWVNPGETVPTADATTSSASHYGHRHTTHVLSTVTVSALPSSTESSVESSAAASSTEVAPVAPSSPPAPTTTNTSVYIAPTTSTSVYVAPTTSSTSEYVAPTTAASSTSAYVEPTTSTSAAPAAASTYSGTASGTTLTGDAAPGTTYTGDLTWYDVGLGACGITSSPSDHIVAIAESLFDEYTPSSGNPNENQLCGKQVSITGVDGSAYTATIVDRCGGCKKEDLDLSEDFFNSVTNNGDGRVHNMSWKFM